MRAVSDAPNNGPLAKVLAVLNSKLGILILGAVATGILIPLFQNTQHRANWRMENRLDALQFQIGEMRSCRKNFLLLTTAVSEAYETVYSAGMFPGTNSDVGRKMSALEATRFVRASEVMATVVNFPDEETETVIRDYLKVLNQYMDAIKGAAQGLDDSGGDIKSLDQYPDIVRLGGHLDNLGSTISSNMTDQIRQLEKSGEEYR
jgi:hypothetical protein